MLLRITKKDDLKITMKVFFKIVDTKTLWFICESVILKLIAS